MLPMGTATRVRIVGHTERQRGERSRPGAMAPWHPPLQPLPVLSALLIVASGGAALPSGIEDSVACHHPIEREVFVAGHFVSRQEASRLYLRSRPFGPGSTDFYQCYLQHQDGPTVGFERDYMHLKGTCRDPATNLDMALLFHSTGKYHDVEFWSIDPESQVPTLAYGEPWYDHVARRDLPTFIADGQCRHHTLAADAALFAEAMAELGAAAGRRVDGVSAQAEQWDAEAGAEIALQNRTIPGDRVAHWVSVLASMQPRIVTFETARYADGQAATNWWILQVAGTKLENAPGVVLLFDRSRRQWRSIYDVASGGAYRLNYTLEAMTVVGDDLFARACVRCDGGGSYRNVRINLPAVTATLLAAMPEFVDTEPANPLLDDIAEALARAR